MELFFCIFPETNGPLRSPGGFASRPFFQFKSWQNIYTNFGSTGMMEDGVFQLYKYTLSGKGQVHSSHEMTFRFDPMSQQQPSIASWTVIPHTHKVQKSRVFSHPQKRFPTFTSVFVIFFVYLIAFFVFFWSGRRFPNDVKFCFRKIRRVKMVLL